VSLKDDLNELGADLYRELLIDHYKNPRNAGALEPNDFHHDGDNPTCGDMVEVYARVRDGKVQEIKFKGKGCAISQASASILYEDVKGKPLGDLLQLNVEYVQELLGITLRPARVKCATLPLVVLKEGIKEYQTKGAPKKALPGFARSPTERSK
jgi:nitrogen fixation protein NifU and related proteins